MSAMKTDVGFRVSGTHENAPFTSFLTSVLVRSSCHRSVSTFILSVL